MQIIEAINQTDNLKHNTYKKGEKIAWLSTLDGMVKRLIIDTHEGGENVTFDGYNEQTHLTTQLLVPAPFDEMYLRWLEAQIDYQNGEYSRYNNAIAVFNTLYSAYADHYHREHKPISKRADFY